MSRSKARARKVAFGAVNSKGGKAVTSDAGPSSAPSASSLVDKAHTLLAQSDFPLAIKFLSRALALDRSHLEARELLGITELEAGDTDAGRSHLLQLFPPHTTEPPSEPAPYLYLAQCAEEPSEALGYYSTATAILERNLASRRHKGKGKTNGDDDDEKDGEERKMAVTALVAMIEIWMSDLCFEEAAAKNCDDLISRALSILPSDPEVRLALASIRMSQERFEEAKSVVMGMYEEIEGKESFDTTLPALPARLHLTRLLLEYSLHLPALDVLSTIREEDSLLVEGAYLEGWAMYLRAEAVETEPSGPTKTERIDGEEDENELTPDEYCSESMRALLECAKMFTEQDHPDEGIGAHVKELLGILEKKGVKPAEGDGDEDGKVDGEGAKWEDLEGDGDGDVEMA